MTDVVAFIAGSHALAARHDYVTVIPRDVLSLQSYNSLEDHAVDCLLRHGYLAFDPDRVDHITRDGEWLYHVQLIKVSEWEQFQKGLGLLGPMLFTDPRDAVNTSWLDATMTIIPICTGTHYFLAVVVEPRRYLAAIASDPASKGAGGEEVLYIFNSKGSGGHDDAAKDVFRAIRLAGGLAAAPQADISSWWTDEIDVPQQPEGHECGIYVAVFVRKIFEQLRALPVDEPITASRIVEVLRSLNDTLGGVVDDDAERTNITRELHAAIVDFHARARGPGLDFDVDLQDIFDETFDEVRDATR